ncbi:MAG: glycosyltransferase family 4 protein [Candidatus Methanomethylophilaceae archaeon]|nr:glycosyltransferase family 4 protein [Candidatus Methanomethylophilaceae archaeon]
MLANRYGDLNAMKVQVIRSLKEDTSNKSGIGYYADFLETQLTEMGFEVESIDFELNLDHGIKHMLIDNILCPILMAIRGRKDTDIVHATAEHCSIFFPFTKAKRIVTFHHVLKKNESNTRSWGFIWRMSVIIAKISADEFIAISPLTKEDMIRTLHIPAEKITVAMHPPKSEMFREDVPKEDIVTFVGSFTERKNPCAALWVLKEMLERPEFSGYRLVMCGNGPYREEIEDAVSKMGLSGKVDMISNLSVEEIRRLYGRSRFLLNTSSFEGLGITTLEAQMCGTPVLYFESAVMPPEVMVVAIPCRDEIDMVDKASELLADGERMAEVIEFGIEYSTRFGKDYNEKLKKIYLKNVGRAYKTP